MRLEKQTSKKITEAICDRIAHEQTIDVLNRHKPVQRIRQSNPKFKGKTYLQAASNVRNREEREAVALAKMGQAEIALKRRMLDYAEIIGKPVHVTVTAAPRKGGAK